MKKLKSTAEDHLAKGVMGTADLVFFVLAGVAPLGAVTAGVALAIAVGNGAGVPGTYIIAALVLSLFAVGYVQMSRRVTSVGGFYTYARAGLGNRAGGAAAYLAVFAYNVGTVGILGGLAYFAALVGKSHGIDLPWQAWTAIFLAIVATLSFFQVTLSAKVLGALLIAEVAILLVLDAAILLENGFHGFSLDVFAPATVFAGGFGISLMFAFGAFVGFEATALYGEEARNPRKSVPRAIFIALGLIALFYLITTWAAITAFGAANAQAVAAKDPAAYMFAATAQYVGTTAMEVMQVLVVTSLFASFLAFHCNTARYQLALSRDGLLPRALSHTHPKYGSPVVSSAVQLAFTTIVMGVAALTTDDPYLGIAASLFGLATLAIIVLQATAAFSIVGFFLRHRQHESVWAAIVAPALGGLGLAVALVFMIHNYSLLAPSATPALKYLPWLLPIAAVIGAIVGGNRLADTPAVEAAPAESALSTVPVTA